MSYYKTSLIKQKNNLTENNEDEKTVFEIIRLLKVKKITVDRSLRILEDAKTILPLITKL